MQHTKASVLGLILQKGNKNLGIKEIEKLLILVSGFFCAFFYLLLPVDLNARQRFIHLSKSSSMSIPSGDTDLAYIASYNSGTANKVKNYWA